MNYLKRFLTVNAAAGAGKTYQAMKQAVEKAHKLKKNTVIVFKTNELIDEAWQDLKKFGKNTLPTIQLKRINGDHLGINRSGAANKTVKAGILDYLQNYDPNAGGILFITESAFLDIQYWPKQSCWHCILDEIPNVSADYQLRVPDNHRILTDHLDLTPVTPSHSLISVKPGHENAVKSLAQNKNRDDITKYFTDLAQKIISPNYDVHVLDKNYNRIVNDDTVGGSYRLQAFSTLKPSIFGSGSTKSKMNDDGTVFSFVNEFASVTIMGACLDKSMMYAIWQQMGISFEPHAEITSGLRYQHHTCGDRLEIRYLFDNPWSKRNRDKILSVNDEDCSGLEIYYDAIKDEFSEQKFVYLVNKDKENEANSILDYIGGRQLPNMPFGQNKFQKYHQAAVLSALNATSAHFKFLEEKWNIDGGQAREAIYHQACYQAIMRTSLRDDTSTEPVKIIVSDKSAAESLQELFPRSQVSKIVTNAVEEPVKPNGRPIKSDKKSRADIKRENKDRVRLINQLKMAEANGDPIDPMDLCHIALKCRSDNKQIGGLKPLIRKSISPLLLSNESTNISRKLVIPLFENIYCSRPAEQVEISIDDCDGFIKQLKKCSDQALDAKEANILVNTTEFDELLSDETDRGLANIKRVWGIWLDLDHGSLKPKELAKIFPYVQMVMFNSWSDGNYRVFIPTTCFMSTDGYKEIVKTIIYQVEQTASDEEMLLAQKEGRKPKLFVCAKRSAKQKKCGINSNPVHGIDASKVTPTSMFYLPSKCEENPEWSFFKEFNSDERRVLDPELWLNNSILPVWEEYEPEIEEKVQQAANDNETTKTDEKIIEDSIAEYRSIPDGSGRHHAFFTAIRKIHYRGHVPLSELTLYMSRCDYDGHQKSRYKEIIRDLASGGYRPSGRYNKAA
jgi:hypothetical protein